MSWWNAYTGKSYITGHYDCADLVTEVLQKEFGKTINLPNRASTRIPDLSVQIIERMDEFVDETDAPTDGDLVLMISRGRINHIGVYFETGGMPYVIHAMRNVGSVCTHRIQDLRRVGLRIEGFYKLKDDINITNKNTEETNNVNNL